MELLGAFSLAELGRDSSCLNDLDAVMSDPVSRRHLSVHLLDSSVQSGVSILFVHVVITSSTLVPKPYAKVLDCCWVLLEYL